MKMRFSPRCPALSVVLVFQRLSELALRHPALLLRRLAMRVPPRLALRVPLNRWQWPVPLPGFAFPSVATLRQRLLREAEKGKSQFVAHP